MPGGATSAAEDGGSIARRLSSALSGEARFDKFTRGRYSCDASIYQILPAGVVFPRSADDIAATLAAGREHDLAVIARGAGTSQNGQAIGRGLVVDCSRHLDRVLEYDAARRRITVEPGVVLETLNARIAADGLFFPVEPSTASRCTIGGMAGNNSCGARSIRYGNMVDNTVAIGGLLAEGEPFVFSAPVGNHAGVAGSERVHTLTREVSGLAEAESAEIERSFLECSVASAATMSIA